MRTTPDRITVATGLLGLLLAAAPVAAQNSAGVTFTARRSELVIEMPAANLPANLAYNDKGVIVSREATIPADLWLHGYQVEIVDSSGAPMSESLLHHISVYSLERRELFSPVMQRIAAAGSETGAVRVGNWIGLPMTRGSRVLLSGMLHNPTRHPIDNVRIRFRFVATSRVSNPNAVAAYPFHLYATPTNEFDIAPGYSEQTYEATPAADGQLVGLGGHLHQYGVSIRFEDVTAGKLLFSTVAQVDSSGIISNIPRTVFREKKVFIRKDHVYRVTTAYNNPTGRVVARGGMGIVAGMVILKRGAAWPAIDDANPVSSADRTRLTALTTGVAEHSHH